MADTPKPPKGLCRAFWNGFLRDFQELSAYSSASGAVQLVLELMPRLKVPSSEVEPLGRLLKLPEEGLARLLDAFGPETGSEDLSEETRSLLALCQGLAVTHYFRVQDVELDRFLDLLWDAVKASDDQRLEASPQDWERTRKFLRQVLSTSHRIGLDAKMQAVRMQHDKVFTKAAVFTDMRPVFETDLSATPAGVLILHMLRIVYLEGTRKTVTFALDWEDLRGLKKVIDRALQKEETLKGLLDKVELKSLSGSSTREEST